MTSETEATLDRAILEALDRLLSALRLTPLGEDRLEGHAGPGQFDHLFGGELLAQALVAAASTVSGQNPQSLHAYFVGSGDPARSLEFTVDRVRDGRSMSARRVTISQGERTVLTAIASFHSNPAGPRLAGSPPVASMPEQLPRLQDWVRDLPAESVEFGRGWVDRPPPLEMRIAEPPNFFGGGSSAEVRTHWMRLPRAIGDDPVLHAALLAHASDYLLLDMLMRSHPDRAQPDTEPEPLNSVSLDHSLWIHGPVQFDQWHRYTQETVAFEGDRGLVRGTIHDADGRLVASVMQEGLVRRARPR